MEAATVIVSVMLAAGSLWGVAKAIRDQSLVSDARLIESQQKQIERLESDNKDLRAQLRECEERERRGGRPRSSLEDRL